MAMEAVLPLRSPEDCLFAKPLPQHGGHSHLYVSSPQLTIRSLEARTCPRFVFSSICIYQSLILIMVCSQNVCWRNR